MRRGFILPLVILAAVSLGVLALAVIKSGQKVNIRQTFVNKQGNVGTCNTYGQLAPDFFLNSYTVKTGDTLLKIAENQLGDSARLDELVQLNKPMYPSISIEKPYIEVGWVLKIPPKIFAKSSGFIEGVGGPITDLDDKSVTINFKKDKVVKQISYFRPTTKYLGKSTFKVGDCIYIAKDSSARAEAGILAISPQDKNYFKSGDASVVSAKNNGKCTFSGFLDKDFFLTMYTVKPGDNISSVALRELGDSSRAEELMQLNKPWYPHLSSASPFIEVGWQLRIPPKTLERSSGALIGLGGEILEISDSLISINLNFAQPGIQDGYYSHINPKTTYIGKNSFNVGDCVYVIEDTAPNAGYILGISPQDKNYFK